ncbi:MptD family putative ECF transporter S component [Carnobacterium gallinarum]|uniref:MptD family putative ECF transporter S component n=1 Tax=Carnobacterium gallinarum TaxID=2749 RepID=UPI00054EEF47|nr:MptD family putative ECF transporter S component [Carnobacterium gallinarum]
MKQSTKLTIRDLVTIGIMSVLIIFFGLMVSMVSRIATGGLSIIISGGISAFFCAPIYMLLSFRVAKRGVAFLNAIIRSLMYVVMGVPHVLLIFIPAALLAELAMTPPEKSYHSLGRTTLSWSIFSTFNALHGPLLFVMLGATYMMEKAPHSPSGERLALMLEYYYSPMWLFAIGALGFIGAALGCLVGWKLLHKHFVPAGTVKL